MSQPFVISRVLDAPQQLVWDAYTVPEHLARWFGPKGGKVIHSDMDFRVGGRYHYSLEFMGAPMWGLWEIVDIAAPDRLSIVQCFSDAEGHPARHPMAPVWPLRTLATTLLTTPEPGKTLLTLHWLPHEATPAEEAVFDISHAGMSAGWSGSFEVLDGYLASLTGGSGASAGGRA